MSTISSATKKMLTLSMLSGVGPATLRKVAAQNLINLPTDLLAQKLSPIARALATPDAWSIALELAEKQCEAAGEAGARIISALDEEYPVLLSSTKDDPFLLYIKGTLAPEPAQSVAIIGTREPTKHGELIARRVTEFFTDRKWSVVSGLALGCDALAHRAALESKGHTVAVLAHGLHMVAPSQHRKLAEQILESGGALVSEYKFGHGVQPQQFVKRDRTQAGLAQGVVMIQSDIKGGSLHASRAALDYERWLAVPYPTDADLLNSEPKVQANLLIADGVMEERANLLKCHKSRLSRVIILKSKDDYSSMVSSDVSDLDGASVHETLQIDSSAPLLEGQIQTDATSIPPPEAERVDHVKAADEELLALRLAPELDIHESDEVASKSTAEFEATAATSEAVSRPLPPAKAPKPKKKSKEKKPAPGEQEELKYQHPLL